MPRLPAAPAPKRRFLRALFTSLLAGSMFGRAWGQNAAPATAPQDDVERAGPDTTAHMRQGSLTELPLDSMVVWERGDDHNAPHPGTHEVLSLVQEERGARSYPWTLFASLATHHQEGDGVVLCSRLHKYGLGWCAGVHSELFNHSYGVALGANIEMSSDYSGPETPEAIGLNIQATGGTRPLTTGIQIHDNQNHFETAVALRGTGTTGIDLTGDFIVGVDLHTNHIRLAEGACIELESTGAVRLRYHAGRIEFLNGDRCFGHLDIHGADHAL